MGYSDIKARAKRNTTPQRQVRSEERHAKVERDEHHTDARAEVVKETVTHVIVDNVVAVEKTSKRFKKHLLICYIGIPLSIIVLMISNLLFESTRNVFFVIVSALSALSFVGLIVLRIVTGVRIWWNHG